MMVEDIQIAIGTDRLISKFVAPEGPGNSPTPPLHMSPSFYPTELSIQCQISELAQFPRSFTAQLL